MSVDSQMFIFLAEGSLIETNGTGLSLERIITPWDLT